MSEQHPPRTHETPTPDEVATESTATPAGWSEAIAAEHLDAARYLRRKHGAGFLVYLDQYYSQHTPADIEEDFHSIYVGTYDDLHDWMLDTYRDMGWTKALDQLRQELYIPEGALTWDLEHFIEAGKKFELFQIHEKGGQIHVFQP